MTELVTFGETMLRLSPDEGERLATARELTVQASGAESSAAVAAARLGADAAWLSTLPDSPLGRRIVGELRSHGVRTGVSWTDSDEGRVGTYFHEAGGRPRGTDAVYDRENAAMARIGADDLPTAVIEDATVFHTTGATLALAERTAETVGTLLETAGSAGVKRSFDLQYRPDLLPAERARAAFEAALPRVDVLFAPLSDARRVFDHEGDGAVEVAHGLETAYDLETVVVHRADGSAVALRGEEVFEEPAVEADAVDDLGVESAVAGGFLAARLGGHGVGDALARAVATGALARTVAGDLAVVTPEEVDAALDADDGISR